MKKALIGIIMSVMTGILLAVSYPAFSSNSVSATNLQGGYVSPQQDYTAASGVVVNGSTTWVDTSSNAITMTLPASASNSVATFGDYKKSFNTHNLTIYAPSTVPIDGSGAPGSAVISTSGAMVRCTFIDNTEGYRCHTY
jgi:hypothetical protein